MNPGAVLRNLAGLAARNVPRLGQRLSRAGARARFALDGHQAGALSQRPVPPPGTQPLSLPEAQGIPALSAPYDLAPRLVGGHRPFFALPDDWAPNGRIALDRALPFPWSARYAEKFGQPFEPVILWRNTLALCDFIEARNESVARRQAMAILSALAQRMREHVVTRGEAAFVENRFAYRDNRVRLTDPWVGALANAFALMSCLRIRGLIEVEDLCLPLARALARPVAPGERAGGRWVSTVDRRGYLWFEEYPAARGRLINVQNGHAFATLALHEAALAFPDEGFEAVVRAGATTAAAHLGCYRRPGQVPLYALGSPGQPDYLPGRAVRQTYQLYELTGDESFLLAGDALVADMGRRLEARDRDGLAALRATAQARRA